MTKMATLNANTYGSVFGSLLKEPRLMPLGPGSPNPDVQSELKILTIEKAFASKAIRDEEMARCCLAGLWLYHDYLDESHKLSQEIETPTGSYWHGLMHRREPDYTNAKYWFRKVGAHPIFDSLTSAAKQLASTELSASRQFLAQQTAWDPFGFINLCEKAASSDLEMLCRQIQQKEWEQLFDFCYRAAMGKLDRF
jgi:hypothetical protein